MPGSQLVTGGTGTWSSSKRRTLCESRKWTKARWSWASFFALASFSDALDGWIAANLTTSVHLSGSAAMGPVLDPELPKTLLVGKGNALLFHNGELVRGTWKKKSRKHPVTLSTAAGTMKYLNDITDQIPERAGARRARLPRRLQRARQQPLGVGHQNG